MVSVKKEEWESLLREARAEAPAIVSTMALTIFPPIGSPAPTARRVAASALRNLLSYMIRLAVRHYSLEPPDNLPTEISGFLSGLLSWLRKNSDPHLFIEKKLKPLSEEETHTVFQEAKSFPMPPESVLNRIQCVYVVSQRLLELQNAASAEAYAALYQLSSDWNEKLSKPAMQLFPSQKPLEFAGMHVSRNIRRIDCHAERSVAWGKELHDSFCMYLDRGLCPRTAKIKTRKDFIAAHPMPVNDAELLARDAFPGHSRPAILRYMKKYLDSQPRHPPYENVPPFPAGNMD